MTPKTLIESTHVNPETVDGSPAVRPLPLGLTKIISADFERFNFRLLLSAQVSTLLTSAEHEWILSAGIKYVSSAYFEMKLFGLTERIKSDAMTT